MRTPVIVSVLASLAVAYGDSKPASSLSARNCAQMPSGPDISVRNKIYSVAIGRGVNSKVLLSMMATAITESWVNNLDCGDKDSLGVFQQRPSQGWGTAEQLMNVTYSTNAYLDVCIRLDKEYPDIGAGTLSQKVQEAEAGDQYTKNLGTAQKYIELAEAAVGESAPSSSSSSESSTKTSSTKTSTSTKTSSTTKTTSSTSSTKTSSSTTTTTTSTPTTAVNGSPAVYTLYNPSGVPMTALVMPSAFVAQPDRKSSKSSGSSTAETCTRAEYPRVGDSCEVFAARYNVTLSRLRAMNSKINDECTNLTVTEGWCVEEKTSS